MKKNELYEQIEAYLNNALPPEEMQAWEQRMAEDAALRLEVEMHRNLEKDYDTGRLQLRANLRTIMHEPLLPDAPPASGGKRRWGLWFGLLGIMLTAVWGVWQWQKPVPVAPTQAPVETPTMPPDTVPTPPKETRQIAMTDPARFKPNPSMEAFVKSNVRSEHIQVKMSHPVNGARFMPDAKGVVSLRFTGTIDWPEDQPPTEWALSFFDNRNVNEPVFTAPLSGQKDATNSLKFDLQQRLKFAPGLYYFTIEEVGKGEPLYAGKFLIAE